MPALSFQEEWLDKLLRGDKQQTTRPQTTRIWVGDPIVHIYNQQRRRITDKSLRRLTLKGCFMVHDRGERDYPEYGSYYHAHFLGKVKIKGVYDIHPCEMSDEELEAWAGADGFSNFDPIQITPESVAKSANWWFSHRYGNDWMQQTWTVIRWHGWEERYFEPEAI